MSEQQKVHASWCPMVKPPMFLVSVLKEALDRPDVLSIQPSTITLLPPGLEISHTLCEPGECACGVMRRLRDVAVYWAEVLLDSNSVDGDVSSMNAEDKMEYDGLCATVKRADELLGVPVVRGTGIIAAGTVEVQP